MQQTSKSSGISVVRLITVIVIFCIICAMFVMRLLYLQITDSEKYKNLAAASSYKTAVLHAQRGEVYDRNGNKLISNRNTNNIEINRTTLASGDSVNVLSSLIDLLDEYNTEIPDSCPITVDIPFKLDSDYIFDAEKSKTFTKFLNLTKKDKAELSGEAFYEYLTDRYDIPDEIKNTEKGRKITAIRYDMEMSDFSVTLPYTLLSNANDEICTVISENLHTLHGIEISKSYTRYYDLNDTLCHVLGSVGPIFAEEADEYINEKGYPYNAIIGKSGIEKVYEEYLRGIDGTIRYTFDDNNDIIGSEITKEAKEGYSVRLTIDANLQEIIENSLQEEVEKAREYSYLEGGYHTGEDSKNGAAAVINVNTGETLALVSFPGYDLNTFNADYNKILNDPARPLINRATMGIYPPGSTFKMLTAAAALDSGTITSNTYIYDSGEYTKYAPTYTPRCWVYIRNGTTHGYVNVEDALKVSCNYFFYAVSDKLGVDAIVKYAKDFGLGVETGIEVPETKGILASPEFKEANGYVWNPGDTLQMSIGQSDNAFTPIQLASYMATVVNGGNRYKTTIFKSVDEFYTGNALFSNEKEILNKTTLSDETVNIIKNGMRSVVDDDGGTATAVFAGKPYRKDIGGKTGTAQVTNGSDTVLFVGFAPFDDPEIAVAVVIENGYKSARAATVASKVFDYYFENLAGTLNG